MLYRQGLDVLVQRELDRYVSPLRECLAFGKARFSQASGSSGLPLELQRWGGSFGTVRPHGNPSHPADYPWQVAPLQSLLPFHQPSVVWFVVLWVSRIFPLGGVSLGFTGFARGGEFGLPGRLNHFGSAFELVFRCDISQGTV